MDGPPSDDEKARRNVQKTAMENEVQVLKNDWDFVCLKQQLEMEKHRAFNSLFDVSKLSGTKRDQLCWTLLTDAVSMRLFAETLGDAPRRRRPG